MNALYRRIQMLAFVGLTFPIGALADGALYAMTNQSGAGKNQIIAWTRAANGQLTQLQIVNTGGGGSGIQIDGTDSLGSQGSLALDQDHHVLFAVNTETGAAPADCNTGTITSFLIDERTGWLTFADRVSSGGLYPDSLTVQGNQLYVLNAGGPGNFNACGMEPNITGFQFDPHGRLTAIPSSTQSINPGPMPGSIVNPVGPLNCDPGTGKFTSATFDCGLNPPAFPRSPAEIQFSPNGRFLLITEKGTNSIYVFPINGGLPGTPVIWKAKGPAQPTYFGFAFDSHGNLIVGEPFGTASSIPASGASALSSFAIGQSGQLAEITADVANGQSLACWVAIDPAGRYAYAANNGSGTISSYQIDSRSGALQLLNATAGSGMTGPNDMAVVQDGNKSYLYALASGGGTINGWAINHDGSLTPVGKPVSGMPVAMGAQGLAAY